MIQNPLQSVLDSVGGSTKGTLAGVSEAYRDDFKESVQTIVWIVSLATGTLVLLVSSSKTVGLGSLATRWVSGLLLATILAGIAQRVAQRLASIVLRTSMILAEIAAASADTAISIPLPRLDWTSEQTMAAAKLAFGDVQQHMFLEFNQQNDASAALALYEMLRLGTRIEYVGSVIEAIEGDRPVSALSRSGRPILDDVAEQGRLFNRWLDVANVFYFAACGLFAAALTVIGVAFIR